MASSLSIYKGSDEIFLQDCDVCSHHNVSSEAVSYCTSCQEFMCSTCDKAHRGSKLTRNHKLQSGSNMPSASTTARSKPLIMFCEHHKILQSKYDQMKVMRNADKKIDNSELDKCLQDMRQIRKDINETLDRIEKTLSKEIKEIDERISKEVEDHVTIVVDALAQISDQLKSMEDYEKTSDAEVMFVGMKRASTIQSTYADTMIQMQEELDQPEKTFRINDILYDVVKQLQSVDTVLIDNNCDSLNSTYLKQDIRGGRIYGRENLKSLVNMSFSDRREIDVGATCVSGCTFMPDGHLVLCCCDGGLILLDNNFNVTSQLNKYVQHVAVINDTEVVVTGGGKEIHRVKLFPKIEVIKTMNTDKECNGVDVSGDEIYVTCYYASRNGEVQVLNMNGVLQRTLGVNNGEYMFITPEDVTVNKDGSKVFVSDSHTNIVTCLDKQGHLIYKYSDTDLEYPTGMYVDREGNLLVCCYDSNNIHVIGQDGRKEKLMLSETDGIKSPICTSFRQSDGCLVVGSDAGTNTSLISFTAK